MMHLASGILQAQVSEGSFGTSLRCFISHQAAFFVALSPPPRAELGVKIKESSDVLWSLDSVGVRTGIHTRTETP